MFLAAMLCGDPMAAPAPDANQADLQTLVNGSQPGPPKTLVLNPKSLDAIYRFALGVSYTGAQVRYQFSPRWAVEGRYQFGTAESDYGSVHSNVFGLRGYRFIPLRQRLAWYVGSEGAYAKASARSADYETIGFALGAFSGLEYRILPRLAVSADIGPYVISLNEKLSGFSETGLDFVVNTAVNIYLF